jgi:hypothetical protein
LSWRFARFFIARNSEDSGEPVGFFRWLKELMEDLFREYGLTPEKVMELNDISLFLMRPQRKRSITWDEALAMSEWWHKATPDQIIAKGKNGTAT